LKIRPLLKWRLALFLAFVTKAAAEYIGIRFVGHVFGVGSASQWLYTKSTARHGCLALLSSCFLSTVL
jgi:hypothetical protein